MSHSSCATLLAALAEELVAVRKFVETLQEEQRLLIENSIDLLPPIIEQKTAQATHLNQLIENGRSLLKKYISVLENDAIQSWLKVNCAEGLVDWQAIHSVSAQAQQLNHINGELIVMKLRHNQQALSTLTRATNNVPLYGPNGQTSFKTSTGRSLGNG